MSEKKHHGDCAVGITAGAPCTCTDEKIDHPKHYNSHPAGIECIDVVEHMPFNIGNAIKYLWRAGLKGDAIEDLKKAAWYANREAERLSKAKPPAYTVTGDGYARQPIADFTREYWALNACHKEFPVEVLQEIDTPNGRQICFDEAAVQEVSSALAETIRTHALTHSEQREFVRNWFAGVKSPAVAPKPPAIAPDRRKELPYGDFMREYPALDSCLSEFPTDVLQEIVSCDGRSCDIRFDETIVREVSHVLAAAMRDSEIYYPARREFVREWFANREGPIVDTHAPWKELSHRDFVLEHPFLESCLSEFPGNILREIPVIPGGVVRFDEATVRGVHRALCAEEDERRRRGNPRTDGERRAFVREWFENRSKPAP
jgi:hypothetical protein